MAPAAPEPPAMAKDLLGYCTEVAQVEPGLGQEQREEAQASLAAGRVEDGLKQALGALSAAAGAFTDPRLRQPRDKAVKTVALALKHFEEAGDKAGQAKATHATGRLVLAKLRPEAAIKAGKAAADLYRMMGDKQGEANALCVVVDAYLAKSQQVGCPDRQNRHLNKTKKEAEADKEEIKQKHLEDANAQAREVVELFRQANDIRGQADMLMGLADINIAKEEFDRAKDAAMMARDLYADLEDKQACQKALQLEHEAHIESGDPDEALATAQELVKLWRQTNNKEGEAEGLYTVMNTHFMRGELEEVMKVGAEARALCQRTSNTAVEGLVMDCIMKSQIASEKSEDALVTAREAIEMYKKAGHKKGQAQALHSAACLMIDKFFKEVEENNKELKKQGFNSKYQKEVDIATYEESVEMIGQAYDLTVDCGDAEGQELMRGAYQHILAKSKMLEDPAETKYIVGADRKVKEVHQVWFMQDEPVEDPEHVRTLELKTTSLGEDKGGEVTINLGQRARPQRTAAAVEDGGA